jgi:hypothetical protein
MTKVAGGSQGNDTVLYLEWVGLARIMMHAAMLNAAQIR